MGCTSSNADIPLPKIFQIQFKTLNLYIDQLPLFMIQKLKQKFDYYCDHKFELDQSQFHIMYRNAIKNGMANANNNAMAEDSPFYKQFLHRLYQFYTDLNRVKLTFKKFIAKYSILVKGQPTTLSNCLYFLYANNEQNDKNSNIIMKKQNYNSFIEQEKKFFSFKPSNPDEDVISQEKFYQYLKQSGFLWEDSRRKFMLIDKEDIPFQAITRALIDIDISDFVVGEEYYILSAAWYERWAYYYQGISSQQKQDYYKSTKLVKQRSSIQSGKKRKSIHRTSILKQDLSTLDNTWVIERPTMITFQDIQGEFREELKQNIKGNQEIRIVSKQLWEMFKKTMPAETEYKRVASSVSTLDLYPKSIYYLRTDKDGQIIDSSFKILHISLKKPLKSIQVQNETSGPSAQKFYFIKNFGDNIWNEESKETALGRCSIYSRFFVVQTTNKTQFIQKYFRNKRSTNSITYGDKVYTFFGFNKKVVPAFVIRLPAENKALIHYLEFNFRYENQVDISDLAVEENQAVLESNKKESAKKNAIENFSFKGISNIGNTCFINSVIQCLIASPILQQYFCKKKFKQDKQPLLYQVSDLAVSLLANKKVSPIKLKKVIDMQMQVFSGYDQHDAQEFLLQLINKMNEQIKKMQKQQETVMEYLFRGKVQTSLQCYSCKKMSKKQQDILSVSLPIPEPEFNTYTVFVFPIYDTRIRKIVLRLHHKCKLNDYLVGIQERLGRAANEYIFAELYSKNLKIRHDVVQNQAREMPLVKMINPSSQIHCFQKFRSAEFMNIMEENRSIFKSGDYAYFDYHDAENERWLYGRFLQKRAKIQIMNQDKSFSVLRQKASDLMKPLGQKNKQLSFKKVITRKYNEALHKMDYFGYYGVNYMIAYPKYVTLAQLERLVDMCLSNFIKSSLKSSKRKPYILRIYELNKQKCIFCKAEEEKIPSKDQIKKCCKLTQQQLNTPLIWVAREKQYSIFVDWTTLEEFNEQFADIQVDNLSSIADKVKTSQKIQIQQCLKLYQQPQNVEIECEKCKHKEHRKTETMKDVPNILVLHMKQYRVTQDMTLVKMDVNLKWIQFLDITKYSINQKGTIYELYAYVRHHGTSQSGHYTCAIKRKHPFENKKVWVNFDDEITGMLGDDLKNIDSAYLLFFQRVDMPTSGYIHFTNF